MNKIWKRTIASVLAAVVTFAGNIIMSDMGRQSAIQTIQAAEQDKIQAAVTLEGRKMVVTPEIVDETDDITLVEPDETDDITPDEPEETDDITPDEPEETDDITPDESEEPEPVEDHKKDKIIYKKTKTLVIGKSIDFDKLKQEIQEYFDDKDIDTSIGGIKKADINKKKIVKKDIKENTIIAKAYGTAIVTIKASGGKKVLAKITLKVKPKNIVLSFIKSDEKNEQYNIRKLQIKHLDSKRLKKLKIEYQVGDGGYYHYESKKKISNDTYDTEYFRAAKDKQYTFRVTVKYKGYKEEIVAKKKLK